MALIFALGTSAQGVLDVHSHLITSDFLAALKQENRLMEEGFPLPKYDAEAHLKWMDEDLCRRFGREKPTSPRGVR